ncbi:MAG: hypothetical protein EXQ69_07820 [Acidimicrobiia bacterium]|nr:hypothetical protein [Acidimicrobiia bacterium]
MLAGLSLIGVPLLVGICALAVAAGVLAVVFRYRLHWYGVIALSILRVLLVVVDAGGWVNRHFDYFPTLSGLLGKRAKDAVGNDALHKRKIPPHGIVVQMDMPGTTSNFVGRPAQIYVPPGCFKTPRPRLPVVMLLAGRLG